MLHRIYIGESVNNVIAIRRLNTTREANVFYACECGLCGAYIERTEISLRLMTALPCAKCCARFKIHDIPKRKSVEAI